MGIGAVVPFVDWLGPASGLLKGYDSGLDIIGDNSIGHWKLMYILNEEYRL